MPRLIARRRPYAGQAVMASLRLQRHSHGRTRRGRSQAVGGPGSTIPEPVVESIHAGRAQVNRVIMPGGKLPVSGFDDRVTSQDHVTATVAMNRYRSHGPFPVEVKADAQHALPPTRRPALGFDWRRTNGFGTQ
jgi:hypothetical protein